MSYAAAVNAELVKVLRETIVTDKTYAIRPVDDQQPLSGLDDGVYVATGEGRPVITAIMHYNTGSAVYNMRGDPVGLNMSDKERRELENMGMHPGLIEYADEDYFNKVIAYACTAVKDSGLL